MTYSWYPGKRKLKSGHYLEGVGYVYLPQPCPICEGKGTRIDKKTHLLRPCVGCKGTGVI
jgi:DnaJ-class molecular chaperone